MKTKILSLFRFLNVGSHALFMNRKHILFFYAFLISFMCSGQVQLIKDIDPAQDPWDKEYSKAVDCNGMLYFTSYQDLWRSNSKTSGTVLVKKFRWINSMISYSGAVYLCASQDGEGADLWRSTGTGYSTIKFKEIAPGAQASDIEQFTVAGSYLFFVANNRTNGKELWRTDGTSSGTIMVKDIMAKGGSSNPAFLTNVNGVLYFAANDGINGYEIWKSNGTPGGTVMVKDIKVGSRLSSAPGLITNVNGIAYFTADDGIAGRELWKSDGTAAGTILVKDFTPGAASTAYRNLTGVNNTLFFTANDKIHGEELWKSDGTSAGTTLVKDLYPGGSPKPYPGVASYVESFRNFASVNGKLYFTAFGPDDYYFWKSDGTEAGTVPLKAANPIGGAPVTAHFTYFNGSVFFCDGGDQQGQTFLFNLLKEDSTGKITTIATLFLNDFYDSRIPFLIYSRNLLYFTGRRSENEGHALFKTSGTISSTHWVADAYVAAQSSNPSNFVKIGNAIYFRADIGGQQSLWKTDGTSAGTIQLIELQMIQNLTDVNGQLYFAGRENVNDDSNWYIYKSDGTPAGTNRIVFEFPGGAPKNLTNVNGTLFVTWGTNQVMIMDETLRSLSFITPTVNQVYAMGDYLYFKGTDNLNGSELWRTNGKAFGTKLIKNINLNGSSNIEHFADLNGILYFSANDGIHGHELWRSDGTAAGTYMVIDTRTGDTGDLYLNDIIDIVAIEDKLYFFSQDQNFQPGIWRSDGTSANTVKVTESLPWHNTFMVSDTRMYFITTSLNDYYLWKSDGTPQTTEYLATPNNGNGFYADNSYVTVNGVFYCNFSDEFLWRSDGTSCGTYQLSAVAGSPGPIEFRGDEIIFAANNTTTGRELYKINISQLPSSPCITESQSLVSGSDDTRIMQYPNPFQNSFSLELKGSDEEIYSVKIMDMANQVYEVKPTMKYNETYEFGKQLPQGFYLLKIQERNKTSVVKIIKR